MSMGSYYLGKLCKQIRSEHFLDLESIESHSVSVWTQRKTTFKIVIFWTIFVDLKSNISAPNVFLEFSNFYYVLSRPKTFSKQCLWVHTTWENCANKYDRNIFWISRRLKGLQCRTQPKEKLLSKLLFLGLWIWLPILSFVISKN